MSKITPTKPLLLLLYGYSGAGKTFFARQLSEQFSAAHVHGDRIRAELFENPSFNREENRIISSLMDYMTGEFLSSGVSVIYDTNVLRQAQRRALRNMALKTHADSIVVWVQIDAESAFARVAKRDRRKADDRFSQPLDRTSFEQLNSGMQNPTDIERPIVISGKHVFSTQKNAVLRRLRELGLIGADANPQLAKPGLVNLVPNPMAGRVDMSRRNIVIR